VYVGLSNNEWKLTEHAPSGSLGPYDSTGSSQAAAANRISYLLGLEGPSVVVDTACSSSLAALHTALNALRCGDCEVALVAAADLLVSAHSLKVGLMLGLIATYFLYSLYSDRVDS
jgi:acyl transferase domain-containing protein